MYLLVQFFWLVVVAGWAITISTGRRKLDASVQSGKVTVAEVRESQIRFLAAIAIPCVLLQIIQLVGGYRDPLFIYTESFTNPYVLASWIISLLASMLLFYWIWMRSGAEYLAKFAPLLRLAGKPMHFRLAVTLLALFEIAITVLQINR